MAMSEISLSDIAAVTRDRDNCGWGDGCGMGGGWITWILLFALLGGGGFGFGGRNQAATTDEVAAGFNFAGINNKLNELSAGQANINQNLGNAICQLGYQGLQNTNMLERQIADCCCTTQRAIDSVKFDMANFSAATNANTVAVGQKILDKLCGMELAQKDAVIAQQGQRIAALEADARMCGIPRTNPYGYGIYAYPACNPCCGQNGAF